MPVIFDNIEDCVVGIQGYIDGMLSTFEDTRGTHEVSCRQARIHCIHILCQQKNVEHTKKMNAGRRAVM